MRFLGKSRILKPNTNFAFMKKKIQIKNLIWRQSTKTGVLTPGKRNAFIKANINTIQDLGFTFLSVRI